VFSSVKKHFVPQNLDLYAFLSPEGSQLLRGTNPPNRRTGGNLHLLRLFLAKARFIGYFGTVYKATLASAADGDVTVATKTVRCM